MKGKQTFMHVGVVSMTFLLSILIQGRLKEGKKTFAFFLDIQNAYDSVWRNAL